jgi:hypothetical protein
MTEIQKRMIELAEVYITQDPNSKDHVTKIMLAQGVVTLMESELIIFEKKKGQSEQTEIRAERIALLKSAIDTFYSVSGKHLEIGYILYHYKEINRLQQLKIDELYQEIENLKKQLEFK